MESINLPGWNDDVIGSAGKPEVSILVFVCAVAGEVEVATKYGLGSRGVVLTTPAVKAQQQVVKWLNVCKRTI